MIGDGSVSTFEVTVSIAGVASVVEVIAPNAAWAAARAVDGVAAGAIAVGVRRKVPQ